MRNHFLILLFLMSFCMPGMSKVVVTVNLENDLTLSSALDDNQRYVMDSLVVKGVLRVGDFATLRDCVVNGRLRGIDMSAVTSINEIPSNAFASGKVNAVADGANGQQSDLIVPLEYITLSNRIRRIDDRAFMMTALRCIDICSRLDYIGSSAFGSCPNLKSVKFHQPAPPRIGDGHAFENLPHDAVLYVPDGAASNYRSFADLEGLSNVEECAGLFKVRTYSLDGESRPLLSAFGDELLSVDSLCIEGRMSQTDVTALRISVCYGTLSGIDLSRCRIEGDELPMCTFVSYNDEYPYVPADGYRRIASRLRYFRFPDGLKKIGGASFRSVHLLSLDLPSTLREIGSECFSEADIESDLVIPEGVSHMPTSVFFRANIKGDVYLPSTLATVNENSLAFHCMSIYDKKNIYFNRMTPPAVKDEGNGNGPFGSDLPLSEKNWTLYVPVGAKAAFAAAEFWKEFQNIIETSELDGGTTGILDAAPDAAAAPKSSGIYTLGGQYVGTDLNALGSGVYVVNGRKVVK